MTEIACRLPTKQGFLQVQRNTKEIYKKIEKIINPVIIYYYNNCSSSDRESHISFVFSQLFPISFAKSTLLLLSYWVIYYQSCGDLPLSLAYFSDSRPDSFLFCLGSFRSCFYRSLRLLVTPLVSDHSGSVLICSYSQLSLIE